MADTNTSLEDIRVPAKLKLSLLWSTLMFLYVYSDYWNMYVPGTMAHMSAGSIDGVRDASEPILTMLTVLMAIPALMIVLSAVLRPVVSRWLNVGLGLAYAAIQVVIVPRVTQFQLVAFTIEMVITAAIVWYALRWPKLDAMMAEEA